MTPCIERRVAQLRGRPEALPLPGARVAVAYFSFPQPVAPRHLITYPTTPRTRSIDEYRERRMDHDKWKPTDLPKAAFPCPQRVVESIQRRAKE
jgi:hypothetical protein